MIALEQARSLEREGHAILISVARPIQGHREIIIEHYLTCEKCKEERKAK